MHINEPEQLQAAESFKKSVEMNVEGLLEGIKGRWKPRSKPIILLIANFHQRTFPCARTCRSPESLERGRRAKAVDVLQLQTMRDLLVLQVNVPKNLEPSASTRSQPGFLQPLTACL
eukprot:767821-Hanusia_phi.AAC.6